MATRTTIFITSLAVFLGTATQTPADPPLEEAVLSTSLRPTVKVVGATQLQNVRLNQALGRFAQAGLSLPDLQVEIYADTRPCGGANGEFRTDATPWHIRICTDKLGVVYEHELAHAWERANVGLDLRERFMVAYNYSEWRSHEVPPHQRAVEAIAISIQRGVSGLPLPPALSQAAIEDLQAYEFLTGRPDPRLVVYLAERVVDCVDRPTALSTMVPDASGLVCGGEAVR